MRGPAPFTDDQRLHRWLSRVTVDAEKGCWLWPGRSDPYARGSRPRGHGSRGVVVHRFVYEQLVGAIPNEHVLHHVCGTKRCINPQHLLSLTRGEHLAEHPREPRIATHCFRGHAFDETNTYVAPNGARFCRACGRVRANRLWAQGRYARQRP